MAHLSFGANEVISDAFTDIFGKRYGIRHVARSTGVISTRGSQPFLTRVPPNQNEPSSRTPKSKLASSRTPKTSFNSLLLGLF
jgi:hypothetical protein